MSTKNILQVISGVIVGAITLMVIGGSMKKDVKTELDWLTK